jgi:hypothetical protein
MITNAQIEHNLGKAYYLRTANPRNLTAPVSKSLLWDFNESPYKWRHSSGKEVTKAMDLRHADSLRDPRAGDGTHRHCGGVAFPRLSHESRAGVARRPAGNGAHDCHRCRHSHRFGLRAGI